MSSVWAPSIFEQVTNSGVDTNQGAGTYDISVATGDIYIKDILVYVDTEVAGLTSVSIQTDDTTSIEILSAVEGLLAGLTAGKNLKRYTTPFLLKSGKKLQQTIVGTGSAGLIRCVVRWVPATVGAVLQ